MTSQINPDGYRRMLEEAAATIKRQDEDFRATHTGLPVDVIVADFGELGPSLEVPTDTLHAYAAAVSTGDPFDWVLGD